MFQSTPPREGRHGHEYDVVNDCLFQSTPPREGRRRAVLSFVPLHRVSIHAPARGATWIRSTTFRRAKSFNPRPRARGDWHRPCPDKENKCFNPRPRARGDGDILIVCAPIAVFQSTPPREGRLGVVQGLFQRRFQSTPPREGRPSTPSCSRATTGGFNPRPRARGDTRTAYIGQLRDGFNPRPRARGDPVSAAARPLCVLFQSTPPREGRHALVLARPSPWRSFNPRPRARGDMDGDEYSPRRHVSIHAPARGATHSRQ